MARRKRGLPPGGRTTSSGRITITFSVREDGETVRRSHSKVLPSEPTTYVDETAAWDGFNRVTAYLTEKVQRGVTVGEFWEAWTDPDHWRWGKIKRRQEQSMIRLRSATRAFVEGRPVPDSDDRIDGHYSLPIEAITAEHIEGFMEKGGKPSNLNALATLFTDAIKSKARFAEHPCKELACESDKSERDRRKRERPDPPKQAAVTALLDRAAAAPFPPSIFGWLTVGTETGMRGGEIDAMDWEHYDRHTGRYVIEYQYNHALKRMSAPKHDSHRTLQFDDDLMEVVDSFWGEHPRWIFVNSRAEHWCHETRDYWWNWSRDAGPSLAQLSGGKTIYNSTRHFWASRAVNVWKLPPYSAAILYGHKDGGKLLTETYVKPDNELAMQAALDAKRAQPVDLSAKRRLAA